MDRITLEIEPLTKAAFAPFGDVIEIDGAAHFGINRNTVERHHDLAAVDVGVETGGKTLISMVTCNELADLPYELPYVERHPLATQAFIPMDFTPMVVAVAPDVAAPTPSQIRAFISNGKQGINYHRNIWHMPMIFLDASQRMLVVDRGGPGNNLEEYFFDNTVIELVKA